MHWKEPTTAKAALRTKVCETAAILAAEAHLNSFDYLLNKLGLIFLPDPEPRFLPMEQELGLQNPPGSPSKTS